MYQPKKVIYSFKGTLVPVIEDGNGGFSVSVEHNIKTNEYFFTQFHGSTKKLSSNWVPVTYHLPCAVAKRSGLEDGIVKTLEDLEFIHFKDAKMITEEKAE